MSGSGGRFTSHYSRYTQTAVPSMTTRTLRWVSRHGDDDLAEVGGALEVAERIRGLGEREDAIDHRPDRVLREEAVHLLEHRSRADVDPADCDAPHQDGDRVHGAVAGENAD